MESLRATMYFAISGLSLIAGIVCVIIAAASAFADTVLLALSSTYIQLGIAAFLFAIWFSLLAIFIDMRFREHRKT